MKKTNSTRILSLCSALLGLVPAISSGQVLFSDDFQTNSSSRWKLLSGSNHTPTNDYKVAFATNYTQMTYSHQTYGVRTIPPSPKSIEGTNSRGLYLTANKALFGLGGAGSAQAAVSLFPLGKVFSNNYALRFEVFVGYNGGVNGGNGSTEFVTFGLNHSASNVLFQNSSFNGDGVWFAMTAEAGTGRDYRALVGANPPPGVNTELQGATGGFIDQNADGSPDQNPAYVTGIPFERIFPGPQFESPGAPGKKWVAVEVKQYDGVVTWSVDGHVFSSHSIGSQIGYTFGDAMIGYMDTLAGVANPPNDNYAIFDNVEVVDLTTNSFAPVITIDSLSDNSAAEPSDIGTFVVTRLDTSGNPFVTNTAQVVNLIITGTAVNGTDYVTIPSSVTIPADAASVSFNVTPINDNSGESSETVIISVASSPNYELRGPNFSATVTIADDGDVPSASMEVAKAIAYEAYRAGKINLYLSGTALTDITVNYSIGGTATNGVNYTQITNRAVITAGNTNALITISPTNDNVIRSNLTVSLTVTTGSGYGVGSSSNAVVTIRNDDLSVPSAVPFTDNFDSYADTETVPPNWIVNKSIAEEVARFGYDYSVDGIPVAPHTTNGTTKGIKLESNVSSAVRQGLSLSPMSGNYTGDYRMRMDVWMNYEGPLDAGDTTAQEFFTLGIGTTADHPNWDSTNVTADGIWFDVLGNASSTVSSDFEAFKGENDLLAGATPVWVAGSQGFTSPYYAEFGGDPAPDVQINSGVTDMTGLTALGTIGFAWHDMVVTKQGTNVTWSIDGLPIAVVPIDGFPLSTNVFFGYYDPFNDISPFPSVSFAIVDNFRVESLTVTPPTTPKMTNIVVTSGTVMFDFIGGVSDTPASFTIESTTSLGTVFTTDATATAGISAAGPGMFHAMFSVSGPTRFYRIRR